AAEHFLQAQALRAKLHLVRTMRLWPAALVFDRERDFAAELYRVGFSDEPQRPRADVQTAHSPHACAPIAPAAVHPLMQQSPLRRAPILEPDPFDVDQRALPRTEELMLECRNRDQRVLGIGLQPHRQAASATRET